MLIFLENGTLEECVKIPMQGPKNAKMGEPSNPSVASPGALHSLLFDSGLFDGDEFTLEASKQQEDEQGNNEGSAKQMVSARSHSLDLLEHQMDADIDSDEKDDKLKERMNKKKNREKQRRM